MNRPVATLLPHWPLLLLVLFLTACGAARPASEPAATPTPAEAAAPTATPAVAAAAPVTTTAETTASAPSAAAPVAETAAEPLVFAIDQELSEARFFIDELLMGAPKTVVGVTKLVDGTITLNPADLSQTTISTIQIDASDLTTDSGNRDRAMRRFILQSGQPEYQYITFEPTTIAGLPAAAQAGDQFSFTVSGNLKVRDIVQPATFTVRVTADSATQLSGLASTTVTRSAYELTIPSVPSVANVSEEVKLELAFVATVQ